MISLVCPRCGSSNIDRPGDTHFCCRDCGKADSPSLLQLEIEGERYRYPPREIAWELSQTLSPGLGAVLARGLRTAFPALTDQQLAYLVNTGAQKLFDQLVALILPLLPFEVQEATRRVNDLLLAASKENSDASVSEGSDVPPSADEGAETGEVVERADAGEGKDREAGAEGA